ncbi:MAG: hypothetical protein CFK48_04540 [Armatimonadetes bacterium CP1_7O]|nr:MAG: hypothetical protein CFK48_04540 [Armatimonadetes bacterium CP1_7O]RMH10599.1 MAG: hypothetical protein D6697_00635 [Armatimonadota bacterium]
MRHWVFGFGLATLLIANAYADGYLWLSAAGSAPASVYRYNLRTGRVDRVVHPGAWGFVQSGDYNLLAYDGDALYIGMENDRTLLKVNPYTGAFRSAFGYNMCNCFYGHHLMKDGAFYEGELWRAAPARAEGSPGILFVSSASGEPTNAFYAMNQPDLQPIGLEAVGDALVLTTEQGIYRVQLTEEPLVFEALPYTLSGVPAGHTLGGLAYDAERGVLYLASAHNGSTTLWRLTLNHEAQTAIAEPVDSLTLKGYPTGRRPTAMGFVPARAGDANDDGCVDDADLLQVLFQFGSSDLASDLNRDGVVDDADLLLVLFQFGNGC